MADRNDSSGIVTLVCITCGREQFHTHSVPQSAVCDKCGSTVFRAFATPTEPDDASIASLEEQARSLSYGDPSPDSTRGDLRDLDMGPR
jgi:DNA-directed RNA polymerase subunit RPC12/RpoP